MNPGEEALSFSRPGSGGTTETGGLSPDGWKKRGTCAGSVQGQVLRGASLARKAERALGGQPWASGSVSFSETSVASRSTCSTEIGSKLLAELPSSWDHQQAPLPRVIELPWGR